MEEANRRYCEDCLVPLTVEHLLIQCPNYINERRTYFGNAGLGLSEVFSERCVRFDGPLYRYSTTIDVYSQL